LVAVACFVPGRAKDLSAPWYILVFKMTGLNNVLVWCQGLQVKKLQFIGLALRGLHMEEVLYVRHTWHSSRLLCSEFWHDGSQSSSWP